MDLFDKIKRAKELMANMPPPPFFASSILLPERYALRFEHNGRVHIGAHPAFWAQVPKMEEEPCIKIVDLDSNDTMRNEFLAAMDDAMARMNR